MVYRFIDKYQRDEDMPYNQSSYSPVNQLNNQKL